MFIITEKKKGVTLVELIVAMSLFAFVSVAATTAMLTVINANKVARVKIEAMDNLSFVLESMTRELRVGKDYYCGAGAEPDFTNDCDQANNPGSHIGFETSEGDYMEYYLENSQIVREVNQSDDPVPLTGQNIIIDTFALNVFGSAPKSDSDDEQPRIVIRISGSAGNSPRFSAQFDLQTTVTQRFPDF